MINLRLESKLYFVTGSIKVRRIKCLRYICVGRDNTCKNLECVFKYKNDDNRISTRKVHQ